MEQTVTVKALRDRWLPAAERPTWVSGLTGVVTDPDSGALVAGAKTSQGLTYRVTSRIEQPTKEELRAATPSGDAALLHVPAGRYEQEFRRLAQQATRGATLPYRQAEMLEEFLRGSARYDITAPPGHSLPSLDFFLRETRRGTSEQFAATFALMARTLGLPTRVVVGFRPGTQEGGVYKVTTGDVIAWAEVRFAGLGWLAFDPTPPRSGEQSRHDVPSAVEKERRRLDQELGEVTADKPRPSTKPTRRPDSAPEEAGLPGWALAVLAVAALALAYVALALLLPWWRRRARRNAGDAGLRVAGAWRQTCDDLGLTGEDALTAQEVVRHGDETHGADVAAHLAPLADITNFARYAPDGAGPHDAEEAWRRSDAVHTLLRRRTPPLRRLTRRLHPRTLIPPRPR
ncbi:transglutaminase family protein [Thermocatellispora tengchongensis]|uniref:transglutaminase family protein n=1 Tax=Thermocatellispora tengchongensis TaxID=1073253 RepID=UPI003640650C